MIERTSGWSVALNNIVVLRRPPPNYETLSPPLLLLLPPFRSSGCEEESYPLEKTGKTTEGED